MKRALALVFLLLPAPALAQDADPTAASLIADLSAAVERPETLETFYERFGERFRELVPLRQLRLGFRSLSEHCGEDIEWSVAPEEHAEHAEYVLLGRGSEEEALAFFWLGDDGSIQGMRMVFVPASRSMLELERTLDRWEGSFGVAAVRLDADGRRVAWFERNHDGSVFPLGSIFKVYVLAEVAERIGRGELDWERMLTVREPLKSLPSGEMQDWETGREASLRTFVEMMIGISDNTATDHLLALVGRESVEDGLERWQNSVPKRNRPFLSTREMFLLKISEDAWGDHGSLDGLVEWWLDADVEERRDHLAAVRAETEDLDMAAFQLQAAMQYGFASMASRSHRELEWFARPRDLVLLYEAAWKDELVDAATSQAFRDGLAAGSRVYYGPGVSYHGFKGGSETQVLAFSVLVGLDDGGAVAVCVCREGFPPLDVALTENTSEFVIELIRHMADRQP